MAMGPIDYGSLMAQLDVTPLQQGFQVRQQKQQADAQNDLRRAQAAAVKAKLEEEAAENVRFRSFFTNPDGTYKALGTADYERAYLDFPGHFQELKAAADSQAGGLKTRNVQAAMTLGGLINAGQTQAAASNLRERRKALVANGESTEVTDAAIGALEAGRLNEAKSLAAVVIVGSLGDGAGPVLEILGYGPKAKAAAADDARADAQLAETARHNRVTEGQGAARVAVTQAGSARADRKAAGGGRGSGGAKKGKLPSGFILD